jgi:DNA processing protein
VVDALTGKSAEAIELEALLVLDRLTGVGPRRVRALVECFGSATDALRQPRRRFAEIGGEAAARERDDREIRRSVRDSLEQALRRGMTAVTWACPGYPGSLRHLADPPPVLFLLGRPDLLSGQAVTIVGARRATARARDFAARFAAAVARQGTAVASGLALGIDGAAHRGALAVGGHTIGVLGTGADVPYPRSHRGLARRIEASGLLVSEFLPGTPALPHHFPRRNRILAALARSVVVVEAGIRSGSLITVDHALDLGREVWAVPGPVEQANCAGSNALLMDGARPLLSIAHFLSDWRRNVSRPPEEGGVPAEALDGGSHGAGECAGDAEPVDGGREPEVAELLSALAEGPLTCDALARRLELSAAAALALLTRLEVRGIVRRLPDLRYSRAA